MTLRLVPEFAHRLTVAARVDGVTVSEFVRLAIADALDARRKDPAFQARLKELRAAEDLAFKELVDIDP
jgi:hypothetical protein